MPASKFRERHHRHRRAADRDLQSRIYRSAPAPAVQEHHLCRRACRRCSTWTSAEIEKLIGEQFKGKEKLIGANIHALHLGRDWALENLECPIGLRAAAAPTRSATASSSRATAPPRSARSMAARPSAPGIRSRPPPRSPTPSRATASGCASIRRPRRSKFAIVQAEDELASIGMVIGAGWNGARAFTATSGPGISLMQEFLGLAYFAEIPAVHLRRAARRPLDRHADPHPAVRRAVLRLCLARRHQARAAVSRGSGRGLRVRRAGLRSRRPAADADLRHARPRHRHEPSPVPAVRMGRQRASTTAAR